jgi:hypothetical protein
MSIYRSKPATESERQHQGRRIQQISDQRYRSVAVSRFGQSITWMSITLGERCVNDDVWEFC